MPYERRGANPRTQGGGNGRTQVEFRQLKNGAVVAEVAERIRQDRIRSWPGRSHRSTRYESDPVKSVPDSTRLLEDAPRFIEERERLLANDLNELLDNWRSGRSSRFEVVTRARRTVEEMIRQGDESHPVEFKSSFLVDPVTRERQPFLGHASLRAIVSLANSGGGIVLIGVSDDGSVIGIEDETRVHIERSREGRAELARLVNDYARKEIRPTGKASIAQPDFLSLEVETCGGRKVLVARVYQAPTPIWMRKREPGDPKGRGPWVVWQRAGASTECIAESDAEEPPAQAP